jgi:hypothetical protein
MNMKYIGCQALNHILDAFLDQHIQRVVLDVGLHLNPEQLRARLLEEIKRIEEDGVDIILGYGLCGRALEGVSSEKSRLILPRVDDCVGAVLGSRERHKSILANTPGCFFLESSWVGTELDVFVQCQKGLERIPENRRAQIIQMALNHYKRIAFLDHGNENPHAISSCRALAQEHNLEFIKILSDLKLLEQLAKGNWTEDKFVIVNPSEKIPFF